MRLVWPSWCTVQRRQLADELQSGLRLAACPAADKLEACQGQLSQGGRMGRFAGSGAKKDGGEQQLHKICCDASKLALEHIKGVSGQVLASPAPGAALLQHTRLLSP